MTHIDTLNLHLSNERMRLGNAKSERERQMRRVWISQLKKEIADEEKFIGVSHVNISDDDLLDELFI